MTIKTTPISVCHIFLLVGCATVNVPDSTSIIRETKEGFLFATIMINVPNVKIALFPRNTSLDSGPFAHAAAVFENLHSGENFIMIKLPAGRYAFKYLYYQTNINVFELEDTLFEIEAGTINYTGRLSLYIDKTGAQTEFTYNYVDAYTDHSFFLDMEYPTITNKYPIRNKTPNVSYAPGPH